MSNTRAILRGDEVTGGQVTKMRTWIRGMAAGALAISKNERALNQKAHRPPMPAQRNHVMLQ